GLAPRPAAGDGPGHRVGRRLVDRAQDAESRVHQPDRDAEAGVVPQEVVGAVDGVDHPHRLVGVDVGQAGLLAEEPVAGERRRQRADQPLLHGDVDGGHEVARARLRGHVQAPAAREVLVGALLCPAAELGGEPGRDVLRREELAVGGGGLVGVSAPRPRAAGHQNASKKPLRRVTWTGPRAKRSSTESRQAAKRLAASGSEARRSSRVELTSDITYLTYGSLSVTTNVSLRSKTRTSSKSTFSTALPVSMAKRARSTCETSSSGSAATSRATSSCTCFMWLVPFVAAERRPPGLSAGRSSATAGCGRGSRESMWLGNA